MNVPANLKYSNDHEWCRIEGVDADPAVVNKDAYGEGWLVKVRMTDPAEYDALLDAAAYEQLIG